MTDTTGRPSDAPLPADRVERIRGELHGSFSRCVEILIHTQDERDPLAEKVTALTAAHEGLKANHALLAEAMRFQADQIVTLEDERTEMRKKIADEVSICNDRWAHINELEAELTALRAAHQQIIEKIKALVAGAVSTRAIADDRYDGRRSYGHNPSWVKASELDALSPPSSDRQDPTP